MKAARHHTLLAEWKDSRIDLRREPSFIDKIIEFELYQVKIFLAKRDDSPMASPELRVDN